MQHISEAVFTDGHESVILSPTKNPRRWARMATDRRWRMVSFCYGETYMNVPEAPPYVPTIPAPAVLTIPVSLSTPPELKEAGYLAYVRYLAPPGIANITFCPELNPQAWAECQQPGYQLTRAWLRNLRTGHTIEREPHQKGTS